MSYEHLGSVLQRTGKPEEALTAYRQALTIAQNLARANPTVATYRRGLARAHNSLGQWLARQKQFAEAIPDLDAGLALCQQMTETDPKNTEAAWELVCGHAYRGWVLLQTGQRSQAAADLRCVLEIGSKCRTPNAEDWFEGAWVLALLAGLGGDARSGVTKDQARTFADQSVAALAESVKTGYPLPRELKEPDFDALRGRTDIRKLVAEVEARAEKPPAIAPPPREQRCGLGRFVKRKAATICTFPVGISISRVCGVCR